MRRLTYLFLFMTAAQAEPQLLKPIIVKASRVPVSGPTYTYDSTTIHQKDIEQQQFIHVLDSLQTIPGINIVQSGAVGSPTTVFTRGTNGNHTQMRLDGMRANDPGNANGSFNFSDLTNDGLEKIETIRGAHSSEYGSSALGGVILSTTKAGSGKPSTQLDGEFGSFHTYREKIDVQGATNWIQLAASASRYDSKRITIVPKKYNRSTYHQKPDPYGQTSFNSRLDITSPSNLTLTLFNRFSQSLDHYRTQGAPSKRASHFQLHRAVLSHDTQPKTWSQHLGIGYLRSTQHNHIKKRKPFHSDGRRIQVDWRHILTLHPCYRMKIIGEWEREEFTFRSPRQHNEGHRTIFGLRQINDINLTSSWNVTLGLSKEWYYKSHAPFDYRLSSDYTISQTATKLLASVGTGFKAPSLFELFGDSPRFKANPHLKSERNFAWDVGFEQKITSQIQWSMTYFHNHLKKLIESNRTYTQLINNAKASTYGIESSLTWNMTSNLQGIIGYTWLRTKNDVTHHALMRRPKHKLSLSILYDDHATFKGGMSALYTSRAPDFHPTNFSKTHRPSFLTVRLFGEYGLSDHLKAHARVENALNRHYQDPLGYKKPGFAAYVGLKYTFA